MRAILAIARRETGAYLSSPIGWIGLCAFLFVTGFFFTISLWAWGMQSAEAYNPYQLEQMDVNQMLIGPLFGNLAVVALLIMPALTMRLLAEDRATKSVELLLTSPIASWQIVLGKFLGALGFSLLMVVGTLYIPAIVTWLGEPDTNLLVTNYASFVLLLATYVSIGLFASSLTEHQLVALVLAFSFNLLTFIVGWIGELLQDGTLKTVVQFASTVHHMDQMGRGLVHLADVVYFLSFIGFFLFATTQRVEALRWR